MQQHITECIKPFLFCLHFQTYGLTYQCLNVDGRTVTRKPQTLVSDRDQYVIACIGTNLILGLISKNAGNAISFNAFKYG